MMLLLLLSSLLRVLPFFNVLTRSNSKFFIGLFFPLTLLGFELEVTLPTHFQKKTIYLARLHIPSSEYDWRYFDELREVLEFDLNNNGFSSLAFVSDSLEETLKWPDVRAQFDVSLWKKEQIAYVLAAQVMQNRFQLIVFDVEKGSSKKYADCLLTGRVETDRVAMHRLTDAIQKDCFGVVGIASLKILYSKRYKVDDQWSSEIWVCDADGFNERKVLKEEGYCMSPGFFPEQDGVFYYVSFQQGQSKIYRSSLNRSAGEMMISLRGSQVLPTINKRGTQMAFITDVAGRPDLFIQNLGNDGQPVGRARQIYSAPRSTQASPTFSPDGKQIAFVSDKDGPPRIYVMEIPGPKDTKRQLPRLITKKNRENTSPAWSPDGTKLAYSAKVDGIRQIWVYDFGSEEEFLVTHSAQNKENPAWAPDSLHLVYNTESDETCELYRVHWKQGDPVLISKGDGQKRFPSWSPSPM